MGRSSHLVWVFFVSMPLSTMFKQNNHGDEHKRFFALVLNVDTISLAKVSIDSMPTLISKVKSTFVWRKYSMMAWSMMFSSCMNPDVTDFNPMFLRCRSELVSDPAVTEWLVPYFLLYAKA